MTVTAEPPLRVSVDAGPLADPGRTGIGRYLESVLPRIVELAGSAAEFTLFAGRPIVSEIGRALIREGAVRAKTVRTPSLYAWQQLGMGFQIRSVRPDVHFSPDGLLPIGISCPSVGVVHDLIWKRFPGTASWHIRAVFALRQKRSLGLLDRAMTDSEATRSDLLREYGPRAEKVRVVPLGVDSALFRPLKEEEAKLARAFRRRHALGERFLLTVGNLMAHKNLEVVLQALDALKRQEFDPPDLAVIGSGRPGGVEGRLAAEQEGIRVRWLGFLPDEEVQLAYRCAHALVFPSLYEGFGFPVLEAMASGIPVLHSARTSIPEVAGEAGVSFDPNDAEDLAGAIRRLWNEETPRAGLIDAGLAQARGFTWEKCAEQVWRAILEAASAQSGRGHRGG